MGIVCVAAPLAVGALVHLVLRRLQLTPGTETWMLLPYAMLSAAPGVLIELGKDGNRDTLWLWALVAVLITALVGFALMTVAAHLTSPAGRVALSGVALLPLTVVVGATLPMTEVKVCDPTGAQPVAGVLVGQTDKYVYVGEYRERQDKEDRRLIAVPADSVTRIYAGSQDPVGRTGTTLPCPTPPSTG